MERDHTFSVDLHKASKENIFYNLVMFPYPSGAGLHVGHAMNYTASDIVARFKRMQWYTVLNPIGWDSFGLPTEGYAMKVGKPASEVTKENVANFVKECELMDWSFDRSREFATSDPEYYKRTQRIFQELYKAGLVYRKEAFVNWCPHDQTVLANDQVVNGACERCGTEVVQKKHMQRFIKITDYAERLINDLDTVDRPEETKTQQKYWIGKSEGAEIDFQIESGSSSIKKVMILHGFGWHGRENRQGWLQDLLRSKGVEVIAPDLVNPMTATLEEHLAQLEEYKTRVDEDTIIVGHSLGFPLAMHFVLNNSLKINQLIGIAPAFDWNKSIDILPTFSERIKQEHIEALKMYCSYSIDGSKLATFVKNITLSLSKNDPYIPYEEAKSYFYKLLPEAKIITFEDKWHFNEAVGLTEFPELLSRLIDECKITVFTTRPDTIYGVTAIMLAPENESIDALLTPENREKLENYRKETGKKTAIERQQDNKEKSGLFSGVYATHPLTNEKVPVRYADYVLPDYATGAVMFVPAHDERDCAFALKNNLPFRCVLRRLSTQYNEEIHQKLFSLTYDFLNSSQKNFYIFGSMTKDIEEGRWLRDHSDLDIIVETDDIEFFVDFLTSQWFSQIKNRNLYKKEGYGCIEIYPWKREKDELLIKDDEVICRIKKDNIKLWNRWGEEVQYISFDQVLAFNDQVAKSMRKEAWRKEQLGENEPSMLINSGEFDGMQTEQAKSGIIDHLEQQWLGRKKVTFKLRDWSISRQRYWGCPIPFYYTFDSEEKVPYFVYTEGNKAFKQGLPITPRQVIQCVVKDKNSDEYCFIKWNHDQDVSTFFGGIDGEEDMVVAAKRELQEEGGFADAEFVKEIGEYHVQFYHPTKERNQYSVNHLLYFEVDRSKQTEPTDDEAKELHVPVWMSIEEFMKITKNDTSIFAINRLLDGDPWIKEMIDRYNVYNPHPDKAKWISHPLPAEELPVLLPLDVKDYKPAGKSPLADHPTFPHYTAKDGKTYLRECDTLDTFMDSAFYFLRFVDPKNEKELLSKELAEKALPVDFYMGGREHTYGHLLYSRFINKFLYDQWYIPNQEPFAKLFHQWFVLAEDGRKMSKRWGNVITPGDLVEKYGQEKGIDILRTYVMFMWPVEAEKSWNDSAVDGVKRFLERVERLEQFISDDGKAVEPLLHKTIKGITEDVERVKFNTAVSKLMVFVNEVYDKKAITKQQLSTFLQLLAPFATKLSQQMREKLGNEWNIHFSKWPTFDPAKIADDVINLPVQINGKMKGTLEVPAWMSQDDLVAQLREHEKFGEHLQDKEIAKIIFVQDKIINFIVK